MKKYLCALLMTAALLTLPAAAAEGMFPAPYTGEDGVTNWGYMDNAGEQLLGFFYADAQIFDECGLAVVRDTQGRAGLVDINGKIVIDYQQMPLNVEFQKDMVAFRYEKRSIYYTVEGEYIGTYEGAAGFFEENLLPVKRKGYWGFVNESDRLMIPTQYIQVSEFTDGYALAKTADEIPVVLDRNGTATALPEDVAKYKVYDGALALLVDENGQVRVYDLAQQTYLTEGYDEISDYEKGYAMCKKGDKWGILTAKGSESVTPQYYYLEYMGEGVYSARGIRNVNSAVQLIDGSGAHIYSTATYEGGFEAFRFGLSWHATADGGVIFFNRNGTILSQIENAEEAQIVGDGIATVLRNNIREYIRLSDNMVLYAPKRQYTLDNGVIVETKTYERYLGTTDTGKDFGWYLEYPQFTNMGNKAAQDKINTAIESFFLAGPSILPARRSFTGSYGFTFQGRVLIVYADARIGDGAGATIWNDNIMLDYSTGEQYLAAIDLLKADYKERLIYPENTSAKDYSYPRIQKNKLFLYRLLPATSDTPAHAEEISFAIDDITKILQTDGACYQALVLQYTPKSFKDVPNGYWAYPYISEAAARELMQGDENGNFLPDASVRLNEACQTISRALSLSEGEKMPEIDQNAWYAAAMNALATAGVLEGISLENPDRELTRVEAMRLMANVVRRENVLVLTEKQINNILSVFLDADLLAEQDREAVAFCVEKELIRGTDGMLLPNETLTRAAFAKLIMQSMI